MILSSSPRSSHTPRHCGQKSISTPCRSEIDSVTLQTGQSMPWLAAADELMLISSRLAEVQILRTSNMHCSSGVSGASLRTRIALGLDGGVFDLEGLRHHLYDATTYRFRYRHTLHYNMARNAEINPR